MDLKVGLWWQIRQALIAYETFIILAMCQAKDLDQIQDQDQDQDLKIEMRMRGCIGRSLVTDKDIPDCLLCNINHSCTVSGLGSGSDSGSDSESDSGSGIRIRIRMEMRMNGSIGRSLVADKAITDCLQCNICHSCTVSG